MRTLQNAKLRISAPIVFFVLCSIEPIIEYFGRNGSTSALVCVRIVTYIYVIICVYGYMCGINGLYYLNRYRIYMILCFFVTLINSLIKVFFEGFQGAFHSGMIMFGVVGGMWLTNYSICIIKKALYYTSLIGILGFLIVLIKFDINGILIITREYVWTELFFWSGLYWAIIPAVIVFSITGEYKIIGYIYWLFGVIINLLFLKRFIIIDSILLIAVILYLNKSRAGKNRINRSTVVMAWILVIGLFVLLMMSSANVFFDSLINRFSSGKLEDFDRFVESQIYFNNIDFKSLLIGQGFWKTGHFLSQRHITSALHIGWSNFIFKGGIMTLLLFFIPTIKAFTLLPKLYYYSVEIRIAILYMIVSSIRLLYLNYYELSPLLLILSWSSLKLMENREHS